MKILVRATNWIGDAVMSLPALRALRARYPDAQVTLLAKPWVAALYECERSVNRIVPLTSRWKSALALRSDRFDLGVLLPNSFESAAQVVLSGARRRVGYARDGRSFLLTDPIPIPHSGEIPPHERFYYTELLRRAGLIDALPDDPEILLDGISEARDRGERLFRAQAVGTAVIGVSPGAAFGNAKRWLPERFAEASAQLAARMDASVVVFGSAAEKALCDRVAAACGARSLAGQTTLREFIDMTSACAMFLTNDSGAMHIAAALGVPSVTIFGPTDETGTAPCGTHSRLVREAVECAPCKLRECPIDHRCMTRVSAQKVVDAAIGLITIGC